MLDMKLKKALEIDSPEIQLNETESGKPINQVQFNSVKITREDSLSRDLKSVSPTRVTIDLSPTEPKTNNSDDIETQYTDAINNN